MKFRVTPAAIRSGAVEVPGDKSISHRALMLGSIAEGTTRVAGFLAGEDCLATLAAFRAMGVKIEQPSPTELRIRGVGSNGLQDPGTSIDLGNSGTAMRLLAGLLCGQKFSSTLHGDASLNARPMQRIVDPLTEMGAVIESDCDGTPPLQIRGGLRLGGIDYSMPVASAQVKSAVLLAGLYANGKTVVREPAVTRDHTERMLRSMSVQVETDNGCISIAGGARLRGTDICVPGDLSSAVFIILAALLSPNAEIRLTGIGVNPTRDGAITILRAMGGDIELENRRHYGAEPVADIVARSSRLKGIEVDPALVSLAIDEFPALFVAAAAAKGQSRFTGLAELRVKESDRISTMAAGLGALGIDIDETPDGALVHGGQFTGGTVDSHGDHRVAMSLAVAGMVADGPVSVADVANVDTSFPGFAELMSGLGANVKTLAPVITIDGPSGSGKGTIARRVAAALGYLLLDSGALYRLTALAVQRAGADPADERAVAAIAAGLDARFDSDDAGNERVWLNGEDVSLEIRRESTGELASVVAAMPAVRQALLERQRGFQSAPGLVADGRDMGTVVFPDAELKIFLTASAAERAKRRHKQLKDKGVDVSLAALSRDLEDRDRRDMERKTAPLRPAGDARLLDSSGQSVEAVTQQVLDWVADR